MTAAPAKLPKGSTGVSRKKSSREQKIEALKYVKSQCMHKRHITETFIVRTWGVGNFIPILVEYGVIKKVKDEDYHEWLTDESIPGVVDTIWQVHGRTHNRPLVYHDMLPTNGGRIGHTRSPLVDAEAPTTIHKVLKLIDEIPAQKINEDLIAKYGGTVPKPAPAVVPLEAIKSFITDCIWDCDRFGIVERGSYIAERLQQAGYLK
jgi:hypothetical protein